VIDIKDIEPGKSYACKYQGLNEERLGIIKQRDMENNLLIIVDSETKDELVINSADVWDIDVIEWV
jgi:hypothetical protein